MARQTLAQEITQYLTEQGAVRVGFADLHGVTGAALPYGITALVALPREIVGPLADQPHRAYYDAYQAINVRLDAMAEGCAALLRAYGYQATANTEEHLPTGAEDRSPLPHKAVACRAVDRGIGARGLRAILEEVMNKIMYDVPSDPTIAKVTITAPCVTEGAQPEIIRDPERQARLPLGKAALRPERGGMPGTNVG